MYHNIAITYNMNDDEYEQFLRRKKQAVQVFLHLLDFWALTSLC